MRFFIPLALTLALAGLLTGCAIAPAPETAASPDEATPAQSITSTAASLPPMAVPPVSSGQWIDLGQHQSPWLGGDAPVPANGAVVPTRVAGLQTEDGRWLAVIVLQQTSAASTPCASSVTNLQVPNSGSGCLRLRRNADFDHWLAQQHPVLHDWVDAQGWATHPRAWVSQRMASNNGGTLEAHALLHPSLIEPTTRDNSGFLAGSQPGLRWARQFAQATRHVASTSQARLHVPPFPFVAPVDQSLLAQAASAVESKNPKTSDALPAVATQMPTRPPAARARQDRH